MGRPEPGDQLASGEVAVEVTDLRQLARYLRWVIVWSVVLTLAVGLALLRVRDVNDDQDRADRREAHEDELEQAAACRDAHVQYGALEPLLLSSVEAAARIGADAHLRLTGATDAEIAEAHQLIIDLMPAELAPILEAFPPPTCDFEEAVRVLEAG